VTDEGRGGPPQLPSPGLGLGLQLMSQLCERMVIGVLHDGRTQVRCTSLSAPSPAEFTWRRWAAVGRAAAGPFLPPLHLDL